jgi:hypothetical protein
MLRIGDLVGIYDNPKKYIIGVVTHIFKEWGGDLVEVYWMDGKRGDIQSSAIEVVNADR